MKDQASDFDSDTSSTTSADQNRQASEVNIYKHLSEANPLLDKIYFDSYHVNIVIPVHFTRLPKELRDTSKNEADTNMNRMEDSVFYHNKMRDRFNKLIRGDTAPNKRHLEEFQGTLFDRYGAYSPLALHCVYRKFQNLPQDRKYFATASIDLKGLSRKKKIGGVVNEADFFSHHNQHSYRERQSSMPHHVHTTSHKPIHFDSNFQSGNLFSAYQKSADCYQLLLQNDINTRGNNQWFFFRVRNVPKNKTLRFEIVNMIKSDSLFNYGMKPAIFSQMRYLKRKTGWTRQGQKVNYEENAIRRENKDSYFYTLSFEYKFVYQDDTVYFSHSYPYTYSDLSHYLTETFSNPETGKLVTLKSLGRSIGKNKIDLLTITSPRVSNKNKKIVWILARQHPGEVTSSYMIEGIISFLTSGSKQAEYLMERIIFKIVPMVNTDGVIHGNSRCELVGSDPNRKWKQPNKLLHPIVAQIKKAIEKGQSSIDMILDLHSHSRKLGTFFYGNNLIHNPSVTRVFPLFLCKNDQRFSFENSRFGGGYNTTARSVLYKLLKIPRVYTVECSFYAYEKGKEIIQYFPDDYRAMGRSLLQNYASLIHQELPQITITPSSVIRKTTDLATVRTELQVPEVIKQGDEDSGSDSDPSEQELDKEDLLKLLPNKKIDLKKKLKKKVLSVKQAPKQKQEIKKQGLSGPLLENPSHNCTAEIKKKGSDIIKKAPAFNIRESLPIRSIQKYTSVDARNKFSKSSTQPTASKLIQTDPYEPSVLQSNNSNRASDMRVGYHLCIIGLKVQQKQVWIQESEVGTQTLAPNHNRSLNKTDGSLGRKSLRIPKFLNALQMKQNNFVARDYSLRR